MPALWQSSVQVSHMWLTQISHWEWLCVHCNSSMVIEKMFPSYDSCNVVLVCCRLLPSPSWQLSWRYRQSPHQNGSSMLNRPPSLLWNCELMYTIHSILLLRISWKVAFREEGGGDFCISPPPKEILVHCAKSNFLWTLMYCSGSLCVTIATASHTAQHENCAVMRPLNALYCLGIYMCGSFWMGVVFIGNT